MDLPPRNFDALDYQAGTLLLLDKPKDWTSFDVVNKVRHRLRKRLGVKKIKVGHSGTLDPMATGLLLIATGKWTKKLTDLQGLDKKYEGTLTLGATTPSYDAETEPDQIFPTAHLTEDAIRAAAAASVGKLKHVPPMFSAIKIDGQPLYKKARRGEMIEVPAREVEVFAFDILEIDLPKVRFAVHCSKGTYIRTLAHDLGQAVGSGAYLSQLRRTAIGAYRLEDGSTLTEWLEATEVE